MSGYQPIYINPPTEGLIQNRLPHLIPTDAFPQLENAYVFRERIKKKEGAQILGRLRRSFVDENIGTTDANGDLAEVDLNALLSLEADSDIEIGSITITVGATTFTEPDPATGALVGSPSGTGTINYIAETVSLTGAPALTNVLMTFNYFPCLPVMGIRLRELNNINFEETIIFDKKYSYYHPSGFSQFVPGTTWTSNDYNFFWTTNYWVGTSNSKIFWATNFKTTDPIRYSNGSFWETFDPQIDAAGNKLQQCLAMVPFRGRMVTFNTYEGLTLGTAVQFRQRIRWAAIGNPFTVADPDGVVTAVNVNAWRDDIRGQGGFLDIPTAQDITSIGFVRDNLVIYCERSTWQLRYTGLSIAPFQVEKVNSELGTESTYSAVQFDTSLMGIGDKGIVNCDSFKSERIDAKIPELVFQFQNTEEGEKRVHGIRDFVKKLVYWTYVEPVKDAVFPNRRLLYNYDNNSWAIFKDSYTALGVFQASSSPKWQDFPPHDQENTWQAQGNKVWRSAPARIPQTIGGNQQGYVMFLNNQVSNDTSLRITAIDGNSPDVTIITSPNHALETGAIIQIVGILSTTDYADLNDVNYGIVVIDSNKFSIYEYDPIEKDFTSPNIHASGTYKGGGQIKVRDNFSVFSKRFNFIDKGENIQLGYVDLLVKTTAQGAFSMNVYTDYNEDDAVNKLPQNNSIDPSDGQPQEDEFFNNVITTTASSGLHSPRVWRRVYAPTFASFIALEYMMTPAQMNGSECDSDIEIDSQILWMRPAGKQLPISEGLVDE